MNIFNNQASKYLREILDKNNISYEIDDVFDEKLTAWKQDESIFYYRETKNRDKFVISNAIPNQAVAATFGSGTLTVEQVRELIAPHLHAKPTFDFGCHGAVWMADFQAIADELNAELESRTCKLLPYSENYHMCSNCGSAIPKTHGSWWLYCPGCGRKLVIV